MWSLKSDLNRHTVLSISVRFIWFVSRFDRWKNQTLCVEHTFIVLANIHVMTDFQYIDLQFIS